MKYSITFKALVIGSLLTAACSSVSLAGQDPIAPKGMEADDDTSVITDEQQRGLEMTMLSWHRSVSESIQEKRDNMLLSNDNNDYRQDAIEFSVELGSAHKHMVQN